ncbi:MAG: cytochrome C [Desulfuromonadales bacterium GWD2_61_12]|nr:MAG: cytochrome C [Desulfuromonadales bacterium GWC2_61_20]OGR32921.1 MAG: cytochrome C [Desulfuromonadales bacterium GWD2_61_12]
MFASFHRLRPVRLLPLLLILVLAACATGAIRERILTMPVIEGATYLTQESCSDCHAEVAGRMASNVHGRLAEFERMGGPGGCQACHGAASLHVADGDTAKILQPGKLETDESAALCASCHNSGKLMDWTHSGHALAEVGCSDCHRIHNQEQPNKANLKEAEPQLCYGCHQEEMAKASFPSHHPIKEGKMTCSSCHNPHGAELTEELANALCFECHARYQGPFVFEHSPVQEDCGICHDPHGTVADNLLKQNEPFLCLQCHESHFHAMRIGSTTASSTLAFDANQLATEPANGTTIAASTAGIDFGNSHGQEGWAMAFGTKCTVCHSVVHGSDLPSQTSPTIGNNGEGFPDGGKGLTR